MNTIPIPNPVREHLCAIDREFIATHIIGGIDSQEAVMKLLIDPQARDMLLDDPDLHREIMNLPCPIEVSPNLYFYVLVRNSLIEGGIDDRDLTDYIAGMLADSIVDVSNPASTNGSNFDYHVDFLEMLGEASGPERFFLHVACGNRFLMLTGIFPEFLQRRHDRRGAPDLSYYISLAQASYRQASLHPLANEFGVSKVYTALGECLPQAQRALDRMGKEYMH